MMSATGPSEPPRVLLVDDRWSPTRILEHLSGSVNACELHWISDRMSRCSFRISHAVAVLAFSVQVQQDRLSFAARHRGEPQSEYDASRHSVIANTKTSPKNSGN